MVHGEYELLVGWGLPELVRKPSLLLALAAWIQASLDVGIEADYGDKGRLQGPVNVGLGHRVAIGNRPRDGVAEIPHESCERGLRIRLIAGTDACVTVMIAWHRKNQPRVILVGLVELGFVHHALAIEVDDVAQVI